MVTVTEGQKAALSKEAANFLSNVRGVPFANMLAPLLTSPRRVPGLRQSTINQTLPVEEAFIKTHQLKCDEVVMAGVTVIVTKPPTTSPDVQNKILLNIHGGAFVMGSPRDRTTLTMAEEMGIVVYSPVYTKAPEAQYPVARDEVLKVYRELIEYGLPNGSGPIRPADIYTMGSSSGAQLLVSALNVARQLGLPMPTAGCYLCAPALDLSGAGDSMVTNAVDRDIMPVSMLTAMVTQNYQPKDVDSTDPLYSPIYADYDSSFPPTVISVGTRDFALSSGIRFYWKLRNAGVRVELLVFEGMWHGFNWNPDMPEAVQAREAVIDFLRNFTSEEPTQH